MSTRSLSGSQRTFVFGAGTSVFAGFPVGKGLWPFLLDHCEVALGSSTEHIDAYLSMLPKGEQDQVTGDLELFLTRCEQGSFANMPADPYYEPPMSVSRSEIRKFLMPLKHLRANLPKRFDVEDYYKRRLARRRSLVARWDNKAMDDFIDKLRSAFIHHHACIRFGGKHHKASPDPAPEHPSGLDPYYSRHCPCYRDFGLYKHRRVTNAIARIFRPGDTIITFNWDVLLESILWAVGKWTPSDGYGFQITWEQRMASRLGRDMEERVMKPSPCKIFKAHGSINWAKSLFPPHEIGLNWLGLLFGLPVFSTYWPWAPLGDDNTGFDPDTVPTVLAPTYTKEYTEGIFNDLWNHICRAVELASEITIAGFSLPPGDKNARERLGYALRRNKACKEIRIVLPDVRDSQWPSLLAEARKSHKVVGSKFEDWLLGSLTM